MSNLFKIALAFFTISFIAAIALNSWLSAVISLVIVALFITNKFLDRLVPANIPEPTAKELAVRQDVFEKEVKAELNRIAAMSSIKNVVGMR